MVTEEAYSREVEFSQVLPNTT